MSRVRSIVPSILVSVCSPSTFLRNTSSFPVSLACCVNYLSLSHNALQSQLHEGLTLLQFKGTVHIVGSSRHTCGIGASF